MKTNHKAIDALDEMLRLMILERSAAVFSGDEGAEQLIEHALNASSTVLPTDEKSQELVGRLQEEIKRLETFGDLLSFELQRQNIDPSVLARATELSQETIERLSQDNLFPNRVPVLLMKRLIDFVGVSLEKAKISLQGTASIIDEQNNKDFSSLTLGFARRRSLDRIGKERTGPLDASDLMDPHIAKTSLDIYLQRLEVLFCNEGFNNRRKEP